MIIVLVGKTASGKTSVANRLCRNKRFKRIITYTTRPMRDNEQQDVDYHFISDEQFNKMVENNEFTEYKRYNTSHGVWSYGSVVTSEQELSSYYHVIILTPQGLRDLSKQTSRYIAFYLNVGVKSQLERLKKRGDEEQQIIKRLKNDNRDFENVLDIVDYNFYTDNENSSPQGVANMIMNFILDPKMSDALMTRHFNLMCAQYAEEKAEKSLKKYLDEKKLEENKDKPPVDAELCFRQRIEELQEERIRLLDKIDSINKEIIDKYDKYVDMGNKYIVESRERLISFPTITKTPKPILKVRFKGEEDND